MIVLDHVKDGIVYGDLETEVAKVPFALNHDSAECNVKKEDFETLPEILWYESMRELIPNRRVVFNLS